MPRRLRRFLDGSSDALASRKEALERELAEMLREEEYLARQVGRAREQVQYYERMLGELKATWGRRAPLVEFVRHRG
jgi:predicted  nucleic acid-binding Zn-ribbon protein